MHLDDISVLSGGNALGHLDELKNQRIAFFHRFNRECGDIGRIRALGSDLCIVNSPETLHEVLVEKAKSFVKSPVMRGTLRPLAGEGLFTSEGELWRRQRKLMAPLFQRDMLGGYAECMADCALAAVEPLRTGEVLDVAHLTTQVAMRVAGKALFDAETLDEADELGEALTTALRWANEESSSVLLIAQHHAAAAITGAGDRLPPAMRARAAAVADRLLSPIRWPGERSRKLEWALETVERKVARMIADRRAAGLARPDLLSCLLRAFDDDGNPMTDKQVRDEIVTLFVAGHETTATALAWALYLLARNPAAYQRVKTEARSLGGKKPGAEDLAKLPYCLQVFKESMRLYPPIYFFGRQATTDVEVGGHHLPAGLIVLISPYALHHRPELWPDPERFDPSRFLPAAEEARHRQAYIPFSAGPRTCIGNHFALMEGPIVLATILGRVDLEMASDGEVEIEPSATLRPRGPVSMRVTAVATPERAAAAPSAE